MVVESTADCVLLLRVRLVASEPEDSDFVGELSPVVVEIISLSATVTDNPEVTI